MLISTILLIYHVLYLDFSSTRKCEEEEDSVFWGFFWLFILDPRTLPEVKYDSNKLAVLAVTSSRVAGDGARLDLPGCHATHSLAHSLSSTPARSLIHSLNFDPKAGDVHIFFLSTRKKKLLRRKGLFSEYCDYCFGLYQTSQPEKNSNHKMMNWHPAQFNTSIFNISVMDV